MLRLRAALTGAAMLMSWPAGAVRAQVAPVADRIEQIYLANNLTVPGSLPFHLKMDFELFDLSGKSSAKGSVEEWWASNDSNRVVIKAPWLNEDGSPIHSDAPDTVRGSYLVNLLLGTVLNPVPWRTLPNPVTHDQTFGKAVLSCVGPELTAPSGQMSIPATICTEPGKDVVRYLSQSNAMQEVTRNSIGLFRNKHVGMDVQILFAGRSAIHATLTTLQGLDPTTVGLVAPVPTDAAAPTVPTAPAVSSNSGSKPLEHPIHVAGGITTGTRIKFVQPEYPAIAKAAHMSGTVFFHALIAKDGTVRELVPLASTDPAFTESAQKAVRQWVYKPYLLNGEPTEVDTTITVNFSLSGPPFGTGSQR